MKAVKVQVNEAEINESLILHTDIAEAAKSLLLESETDYENAGQMLVQLKSKRSAFESQRDDILKPLNEAVKRIRALYKPALDSLLTAENAFRSLMLDYKRSEAAAKEIVAQKAQKLLKAGQTAKAMVLVEKVNEAPVAAVGVSTRKTWTLEIVDAAQIPAQFWVIDERALRDHAKANAWSNPPPGVKYVQVESLSVRT